jgi:FAD/FMN-containing dehydrogenase/Fe-S oxidoreductase
MPRANLSQLEKELQRKLRGEVSFDRVTRQIYSTDASLYEIEPLGVITPRDENDVVQTIRTAAKYEVAILPRGGGTSLAGQTVGEALVLDCSKHMTAVREVNVEERWARVEPGLVRDVLNAQLKPLGLHFTPDVATSSRATVGGMIANNSAGTHSIVYGKTVDQVMALRAALSNGEVVEFKALTPAEYEKKCGQQDLEGNLYREVRRLVRAHADEIRSRFPKVMRRAGGYNLDLLLGEENWNLAKIVCGCEGTLAFVTEAQVRLEPLPKATALLMAHFRDNFEAVAAVEPMLKYNPAAVELLDSPILKLAAQNLEVRKYCTFVEGEPEALLMIEFFGDTAEEVLARLEPAHAELLAQHRAYACTRALSAKEQANVWHVRKASLGLLQGLKSDFKPTEFIEDAAVPVAVMPQYLREVVELVRRHNREVTMYAHVSVGLTHVRPFLNLKQEEDVRIMRDISEGVLDLVLKYGGMMSGEHGDGLVRSYLNEKFFGPKLYQAFREIKRAFDPQGRLNPGKIVDAQGLEENLRIGPHYHPHAGHTHFHYLEDRGFARAVEMCTGVGECRKVLGGTMCPSYMVTRDEKHSTRGRANALRAGMTGKLGVQGLSDKRLYEVFELCLACKGCKAECPSNVDMAKLKYEFLAHYYDEHRIPFATYLFAHPEVLGKLASPFAGLVNRALESKGMRKLLQTFLGIDARRTLPAYARETFERWFNKHAAKEGANDVRPRVALFNDTFMNYHEPEIGVAAVRVLEALGYRVVLAQAGCCGRALISNGLLRTARQRAETVVERLAELAARNIPMVGCEPSCTSAIKEDYPDLVRDLPKAKLVAENFFLIEEFVARQWDEKKHAARFKPLAQNVLYHGHCHHKALFGTEASKRALAQAAGCNVYEVDSGCCGMAGAFGYEKKHYEISMKIGEQRLFQQVNAAPPEQRLAADGFSCRHQIEHGTGRKAKHAIEILAEALV